jgi:hypothetical protein
MRNNINCPVCKSSMRKLDEVYLKCPACGLNVKESASEEITNDNLNFSEIIKKDGLTKFKLKLVKEIDHSKSGLLDVGTASGKFLFHARPYFKSVQGIEVNQKCIEFADQKLNLKVVPALAEVELNKVSCITFWHSLEHIPIELSKDILTKLNLSTDAKILISVPNASSTQFKIFGDLWPYYDKASHIYQYSPNALIALMQQCGYQLSQTKIGFMYELFGFLQGFINKLHPIPNYFYYRKKRGWNYGKTPLNLAFLDIYNYLLLAILLPFSFLATVLCSFRNEGVINYVFTRNQT